MEEFRKCDEEDGVFRREKYASDMLKNLNLNDNNQVEKRIVLPNIYGNEYLVLKKSFPCICMLYRVVTRKK